ncbi:MAG: cyclic pyranopterin monophosphate synthase MoaC [Elusimicrobia bacterium]|nr:cyclic pyranopterin monophosphate synthase MoaC [Elusimicrobiota bacterium]
MSGSNYNLKLSHFNIRGHRHVPDAGQIAQVDIADKNITLRRAKAFAQVKTKPQVIRLIRRNRLIKGNALTAAKIAGIMAAKRVDALIPLCHSLNLDWIDLSFNLKKDRIEIISEVKTKQATGVEMEALTAVTVAGLTIYDMIKSLGHDIVIGPIYLMEKSGGASGHHRFYRSFKL